MQQFIADKIQNHSKIAHTPTLPVDSAKFNVPWAAILCQVLTE